MPDIRRTVIARDTGFNVTKKALIETVNRMSRTSVELKAYTPVQYYRSSHISFN